MTLVETLSTVGIALFTISGWLLYFRERNRSRDYATDLAQLVHDHDLGRDDLRRSLQWDEIEERVRE
jgi:hypothetical protein